MVAPTIVFNSGTGSDTAASGAGPSTALTGTAAANRVATTGVRVGFFEGTPPDLSGVSATGSDALWVDTASGRQYSDITAVNNTTQASTTGGITTGTATLVVVSSTGMAVGDLISVAGAGAAGVDLYTTISTINGDLVTITVADNAGTTVAGAAVVRPKQVTIGTGLTVGQVGKTWAIGGKRATWDHADSRTAFADAKAGWTIQTETDQNITTSAIAMPNAGDGTTGPVTVTGSTRSPRPIITQSANAGILSNTAGGEWRVKWLDMRNSNATKTSANGIAGNFAATACTVIDCILGHATNKLLTGVNTPAGGQCIIIDTEILYCTSFGVRGYSFGGNVIMLNCNVHHCAGGVTDAAGYYLAGNRIWANTADGININVGTQVTYFINNTIDANTGDGIDMSTSNAVRNTVMINNNITANGNYGIRGRAESDVRKILIDYNNLGTGATANTSGSMLSITAGANDLAVDPGYTNASTGDFTPGANVKNKGFPTVGGTDLNGAGNNVASYVDLGAIQTQATGGGGASSYTYAF